MDDRFERASLNRLYDPVPHVRPLSNGRYSVLITSAGTGYSAVNDRALTHWSADRTEDANGLFVYLRDTSKRRVWSLGHQPVVAPADHYDARYQPGKFEITRRDHGIESRMEICVAPEDDFEIRRISLRNHSDHSRRIELTSYAEVVLNLAAAHAAHPAFSKLFVQTELLSAHGALLAKRRARSPEEQWPYVFHVLAGEGSMQFETDRARFIGRGRTLTEPLALTSSLSGTVGNVLDPVLSIRRVVELKPGASTEFVLLLGAATDREAALRDIERGVDGIDGVFDRATAHERAEFNRLGMTAERAEFLQELAGAMLYRDPALRATPHLLQIDRDRFFDPGEHGVSANTPFVLVCTNNPDARYLVDDLVKAQAYWRTKRLRFDLLVVSDDGATLTAVRAVRSSSDDGRLLILRRAEISTHELDRLRAYARMSLTHSMPTLMRRGTSARATELVPGEFAPARSHVVDAADATASQEPSNLQFFNGYGGFDKDGTEYVIRLTPDGSTGVRRPPMPWINVIANEDFGCLVSETGAGYTWSRNSREHRLTPWYNDPVTDSHAEALYLRDEDAGVFWSPVPGPVPGAADYEVRHSYGYTRFRHVSHGLAQNVCVFVPQKDPIKFTRVRLQNHGAEPRRISIFIYQRLVLGVLPEETAPYVVTEFDSDSSIILARNALGDDFADGVTFAALAAPAEAEAIHYTADRAAFVGRNGSLAKPAALCRRSVLDDRVGTGLDPCAAFQVTLTVAPAATVECTFLLGESRDTAEARTLVSRYRRPRTVANALQATCTFWLDTLSAVHVETPEPTIDLMLNGWLLYQVMSCRLWGRSAFYQSGGAFGFRDQLQDAAALVYSRPDLTRVQIVRHAAHQFVEGDVLHWWHPPVGRGLRTRFSDDLLWLPYVAAFYVKTTGDVSVLEETVSFVRARTLKQGEEEAYLLPVDSGDAADIYEHCARAIDRALTRGVHGLPLMGTGDWNDGMNRVGREGRGESVWLGFFLYRCLSEFIPLCERRLDHARARRYRKYREKLGAALEAAWDGAWYRRAYYDDGTPLGSAHSDECRIDAIAQAWSVISGAASAERAARAMDAVEQYLVSEEAGVIRLLAPPFDKTEHDPGYIKGYVPGIRENGGQYTHAALWVVRALAELGRRD